MRLIMLACAALCAGCLHAQAPPTHATDPSALAEFSHLLEDPAKIAEASEYADSRRLTRREKISGAAEAYARYMRYEAYASAAEIAWRFGFGQRAIDAPMSFQRKRAGMSAATYIGRHDRPEGAGLKYQARQELAAEALIGCVYSSKPGDGLTAADDIERYRQISQDDDVLFPLLDDRCPVDDDWRDVIIGLAFSREMDDYAIRNVAASDWMPERKTRFAWGYFNIPRCAAGFRAVAALRVPKIDVISMVETSSCEQVAIRTDGWSLSRDDAGPYFFAAVRGRKFNLALSLLPFTDFGKDGLEYVFQEAVRGGYGADLVKVLAYHSGLHDPFMSYAYDQGRYRFVGTYAQTYDWQKKAFDKLIELGQYDFAAEAAEYGVSETLRSQGVIWAFQAAMAAGDFKSGRYFVARYGPTKDKPGLVTQAMYDAEKDKWFAAKAASAPPTPEPPKKKRAKPKLPPCPKGDWSVGPCE